MNSSILTSPCRTRLLIFSTPNRRSGLISWRGVSWKCRSPESLLSTMCGKRTDSSSCATPAAIGVATVSDGGKPALLGMLPCEHPESQTLRGGWLAPDKRACISRDGSCVRHCDRRRRAPWRPAAQASPRDVLAGVLPPRPEDLHPTDLSPGWGVPSQIVKVEILASTPLKH